MKLIFYEEFYVKFYVKGEGGTFDFPPIPLHNPVPPFKRVLTRRTAVLSYGFRLLDLCFYPSFLLTNLENNVIIKMQ